MEKRYMRAIPLLIGEAYSKALYNAIIKDEILKESTVRLATIISLQLVPHIQFILK